MRRDDEGVALINVLLVMAVSAALVQTMLTSQEKAIAKAQGSADRAQAFALAKGGVASLRTALRRDIAEAPESDHLREEWAQIAQEEVTFDFGSYAVSVSDAQGRFNLNGLSPTAIARQRVFSNLLRALELPQELGTQITDIIRRQGILTSVDDLRRHGVSAELVEGLRAHVTALPPEVAVNLNTATEPVLAAVFGNEIVARGLHARRMEAGFLTREDLSDFGVVQPAFAGWRSDSFDTRVTARVGDVEVVYQRRILRDPETGTIIDLPLE